MRRNHRDGLADPQRPVALFVALFALSLGVYAVTAQRGVGWQDSGEFQYRVLAGDFNWISGLARAHPWYILMAGLFSSAFPSSLQFYAINLFSGVGMSVALLFLGLILWELTRKAWAVGIAAAALGLAHMAWWMSAVAEVYTWSAAFLLAEVFCLLNALKRRGAGGAGAPGRRGWDWWVLLALVNGMHASLHNFAFLNLPVYGVLFVAQGVQEEGRVRLARTAKCLGAWLAGAALLVGVFAVEWWGTGSFAGTVKSLLFGREFEQVVLGTRAIKWPLVAKNYALAGVSFLNPCWLFVGLGWRAGKGGPLWRGGLAGLTAVHGLFWIRYFVADQATFVLPLMSLLAVWLGLGLASRQWGAGRHGLLLLLVLAFAIAGPLAVSELVVARYGGVARSRTLPFRDEARYWLLPWKQHEDSAARFVDEVRGTLRGGDVLVADNTAAAPVVAAQEAGILPRGIRVIAFFTGESEDELVRAVETSARAYIVSPVAGYASAALLGGRFQFQREGALYRITETSSQTVEPK